jgi:hypothetical protein
MRPERGQKGKGSGRTIDSYQRLLPASGKKVTLLTVPIDNRFAIHRLLTVVFFATAAHPHFPFITFPPPTQVRKGVSPKPQIIISRFLSVLSAGKPTNWQIESRISPLLDPIKALGNGGC